MLGITLFGIAMDLLTGALTSSILWWLAEASTMPTHLKLEPYGSVHAFFTGDSFFVTCSACEDSRATRLTWQGPSGRDITNSHGRVHVEPAIHNPMGLQLVVEEVRYNDRGTFTCSAIVDGAEVKTQFSLQVHQSITFLGTPIEQQAIEKHDFLLVCNVRSDPNPLVSWYVNGTAVQNSDRVTLTEDGLSIRKVQKTDAGNYTCRAFVVTPHSSQLKDIVIRLDVHYRPVWLHPHSAIAYGRVSGTAHLVCEAHSNPAPVFEWYREKALLGTEKNYRITNHKWKSILKIEIKDHSAFGNYECGASNSLGEIKRYISLFEGFYPNPPVVSVTSEEPGTLTVGLKPSPGDQLKVLSYRFQCRLQTDDWSIAREYVANKEQMFLLQDLNFEAAYVIRAKARNEVGFSDYSKEVVGVTKGIVAETVMGGHGLSSPSNSALSTSSRQAFLTLCCGYLLLLVACRKESHIS